MDGMDKREREGEGEGERSNEMGSKEVYEGRCLGANDMTSGSQVVGILERFFLIRLRIVTGSQELMMNQKSISVAKEANRAPLKHIDAIASIFGHQNFLHVDFIYRTVLRITFALAECVYVCPCATSTNAV